MSLIKCPECGREGISDGAEACPDCGYGIRAHFEREEQKCKDEVSRKTLNKLSIWSIIWTAILIFLVAYELSGLIVTLASICSIGGWFILFVCWVRN